VKLNVTKSPDDQSQGTAVRVMADRRIRSWHGQFVTGGSPWRLVRLAPQTAAFLAKLRAAGGAGLVPEPCDAKVAAALIERGLIHPMSPRQGPHDVQVVVPAFGRPEALDRCLTQLGGLNVIVVDDATPDRSCLPDVAQRHGVAYMRLDENRGPAAARNAGADSCDANFLAFVDSDCQPVGNWIDQLMPFFDDPKVGAVAPRIVPVAGSARLLERFEATGSALDMGEVSALVRPGARLGFLPSATLVVRRAALADGGFDEHMRLGEDVDLVWRLADAGWHVRYAPSVVVTHEMRDTWGAWIQRRFEYGTSVAALEARHPGRLAPLRLSPWNAASLALLATGWPLPAAAVSAIAAALLARQLRASEGTPVMAVSIVAMGVVADGLAVGHALRREYWPLGALALVAAPRLLPARAAVGLMLLPLALEWAREPGRLDPIRYAGLRLVADAAYGTGVLVSAWRHRMIRPVAPRFRRR
jgi:mycofactocin system glycosyltransferase